MPPYFKITQDEKPDFSVIPGHKESGWLTHGFHSHPNAEEGLRKRTANYYGKISFMDQQIGRILDAVDRLGIADNTIVVFTSDHGHYIGQHGLVHKGPFHYEDMLRVPMIARYPSTIPAGKTDSSMQALIDLPETFLEAAGIPVPGLMQGKSQWKYWQGNGEPPIDHVIVENRHQPTAIHLRTFINQRYKVTVYRGHPFGDLFDLKEDPEERRNLWDDPAYVDLKLRMLHKFMDAELQREPTRHQRIHVA